MRLAIALSAASPKSNRNTHLPIEQYQQKAGTKTDRRIPVLKGASTNSETLERVMLSRFAPDPLAESEGLMSL